MIYSYSRIKRFEQCPLAYRFKYIDKVEIEEFDTIEAFMGSRVHESLDVFYAEAASGSILPLSELLGIYKERWRAEMHPGVVVNSQELTESDYFAAGEKCIQDYYERYSPFDASQVVGTEVKVLIDLLGDGRYRFLGYIDRLDRTRRGCYEIHDYKTGGSAPSRRKAESDRQLALYEIGLRQCFPEASEVSLVWHYLRHNQEVRARNSPSDLDELKSGLVSSVEEIKRATREDFFPEKRSALCSWCEYGCICRKKRKAPTRQTSLSRFLESPQERYYELQM